MQQKQLLLSNSVLLTRHSPCCVHVFVALVWCSSRPFAVPQVVSISSRLSWRVPRSSHPYLCQYRLASRLIPVPCLPDRHLIFPPLAKRTTLLYLHIVCLTLTSSHAVWTVRGPLFQCFLPPVPSPLDEFPPSDSGTRATSSVVAFIVAVALSAALSSPSHLSRGRCGPFPHRPSLVSSTVNHGEDSLYYITCLIDRFRSSSSSPWCGGVIFTCNKAVTHPPPIILVVPRTYGLGIRQHTCVSGRWWHGSSVDQDQRTPQRMEDAKRCRSDC